MSPHPQTVVDCVFCRIIAGDEPAKIVHETARTLAFLPLHPAATGHTLVVPKDHLVDLYDLDHDLAGPLLAAATTIAGALRDAWRPDGMNLINSTGRAATQTVPHLHLHLVPRWHGDNFGGIWPAARPCRDEDREEVAELIRSALSRSDATRSR